MTPITKNLRIVGSMPIPKPQLSRSIWQPVSLPLSEGGGKALQLAPLSWQPSGAHEALEAAYQHIDYLTARIAALENAAKSTWLPIADAPKDGTDIFVRDSDAWPVAARWYKYDDDTAAEYGVDGYWNYSDELLADVTDGEIHPTEWAPIPDGLKP